MMKKQPKKIEKRERPNVLTRKQREALRAQIREDHALLHDAQFLALRQHDVPMKKQMEDIREFYKVTGAESQFTALPTGEVSEQLKSVRQNLILEEVAELFRAMNNKNMIEIFDALLDIEYVVLGTALTYGFEHRMADGWAEVHRSNMAKVGPDGKVHIRPDGKIMKPAGWIPPDLRKVLSGNVLEELEKDYNISKARSEAARTSYSMADHQSSHEKDNVEWLERATAEKLKRLENFKIKLAQHREVKA
jgi:predicted HAD superfamily Cof-like phosphohydrolase